MAKWTKLTPGGKRDLTVWFCFISRMARRAYYYNPNHNFASIDLPHIRAYAEQLEARYLRLYGNPTAQH